MNVPLVLLNRRRLMGSTAPFTPAGLFALAEPGVWYDPSDLTTLFQDTAGTLPVTTPGQTVALALDKSKGLVLGSEAASNSWGGFQCNVTSSGGNFTATATANNDSRVVMQIPAIVGRTYRISVGLVSTTSGTVSVGYNETASSVAFTLATGIATISVGQTSTFFVTATNTNINLVMRSVALAIGQTFVFAPASVKELPGFHATQATLASRPTYGIVPLGGRRNLLTRTEEFNDAAWSNFGLAAFGSGSVVNAIAAPDGTVTADLLTENSSTSTHVSTRADGNFTGTAKTFSVHAKANGRRYIGVAAVASDVGQIGVFDLQAGTYIGAANGPSGGTGVNVVAASIEDKGNGWYRCSVSFDVASASRFPVLYLMNGTASANASYAGNGTAGIYIWGAQLETGSSATAYQRVGSAFDVTEAGVASLSYLSFDGVDDFLITPTITPGIDKAQVFAGVRKLSDAATGTIAELSIVSGTQNGSFMLTSAGQASAGAKYGSTLRGTALIYSDTPTNYAAPITNVVSLLSDIGEASASAEQSMRINGAAVSLTTVGSNAGTGNFLAYPLYIGRRGGTSSPANMNLSSLIVRFGTNLDAGTITSTETWVNGKTGAYA